jgi:cytochrome oxidase Cu insertion factor (SCO1/SenC/PrrC family)
MNPKRLISLVAAVLAVVAIGLALGTRDRAAEAVALGPADGHELPPADLERVAVGGEAPDFALAALSGDTVTLSEFQGDRNVVLVFYRGHW